MARSIPRQRQGETFGIGLRSRVGREGRANGFQPPDSRYHAIRAIQLTAALIFAVLGIAVLAGVEFG